MELLGEIYTEHNFKNTERLQLNNLVLRILNQTATDPEKAILQSTSSDKSAIYIKVFQTALGVPATGIITDRAKFKRALTSLLWTYEKPPPSDRRLQYSIPFRHFQSPRAKEEIEALVYNIYPFACKFSPERIKADGYGEGYKNTKYKLESVDTSASYYDCLVHSFLTSMSTNYRKLSDNQRTAFAYYIRRVICPRYIKITDMMYSEFYKKRKTLSLEASNQVDIAPMTRLRNGIDANEALQEVQSGETKKLIVRALNKAISESNEERLAREFIREYQFLEDEHAKLLADAFHINILIVRKFPGIGLSLFAIAPKVLEPNPTHTIVLYNPGDGHFRAVRRVTDSNFYFTNDEIQAFKDEETARQEANVQKTRCPYAIGEIVLHNGVEKTVTGYIWESSSDSEGYMNCESVQLNNETVATPLSEVRKKTLGGKRTTRKERRIFLKT
jgi:hypothetical protein